ncbi:proteasome activator pa28 REG alpha beta subunit [Hygrophoropsis aurantiaca]|uniref:Proteasome activator pa28 REG alpha beta subunit n=1 Tax=Hygrophoropsis aurantiaca TaxID=72124 RepID=A0ACB8AN57_9AGAM|nr:proteasome activator pa28 REG alpha beta subunit [Hygrophoropsis aurantiaca]
MAKSMDKEVTKKLEQFRGAVATAAEDVIFHKFPTKVSWIELSALIDSTGTSDSPYHISHGSLSTDAVVYPPPSSSLEVDEPDKKRKRTIDGSALSSNSNDLQSPRYSNRMRANQHIIKLHDSLKTECSELADSCDKVKLWVNLTMPKIEDGDNFGVQIQEEVLSELLRAQESAYNLRDGVRQDHLNRAKICSKIVKYPNIEDYTLSLKEHDEKQLFFARQHLIDIRNIYAVLTDILHKNIAKIRAPKANNGVGLY